MEKFIEAPRHIEFQVIWRITTAMWKCSASASAPFSGGIRNCSRSRPRQPSAPEQRNAMIETLREAMRAIGYTNAGTVEFLMDETGKLYFIEVNARIQVEHPVTEVRSRGSIW